MDARSGGAKSVASRRSVTQDAGKKQLMGSKSSNFVKPTSPRLVDGTVHYEDPASKLNIDDAQWNDIVQNNLKKHEEDEMKAKQDKLKKAQTI